MQPSGLPEIFADFNNADCRGRLRLSCHGTEVDLRRLGLQLEEGMEILVSDRDSLSAVGTVEWSCEEGIWVATIDRNEIRGAINSPE